MKRKLQCPQCKKETHWEENPWRPFCSQRCKLIDLGDWASERNAIAGEEVNPNEMIDSTTPYGKEN